MVEDKSSLGQSRRRFDRDVALARAMERFWRHGYEATSMADLLRAMELNAPSLYAAFGNKESLFVEAAERYAATYVAAFYRALEAPTSARETVQGILRNAARAFTSPDHPSGCFFESGAANCSEEARRVQELLRTRRAEKEAALRDRLAKAIAAGELPQGTDPARLAKFFGSVLQGMSAQARDGASLEELESVGEQAMAAWPNPS